MLLLVIQCNKLLAYGRAVTTNRSHTKALYSHKQMRCWWITVVLHYWSGMGLDIEGIKLFCATIF